MPKLREPVIYDSSQRPSLALEELRNAFFYRDFILQLIRRDVVSRYKRSLLGIVWTMLNPLGMMLVLAVVFSQLFEQIPDFQVYILSGLVAWNFFSQTTSLAMSQMIWGSSLLHRIYIPRTAFVISSVGTGLVNLTLALVPLGIIILLSGMSLRWSFLFLPVSMFLLAVFSLGVSLMLSAWAVYFPDIVEMYKVVLIAWMYLIPIIYPPGLIAEKYRFWLFHLNPMYYLIEIFRRPLHSGELPSIPLLLGGAGTALVTLIAGWFVFTAKADEFTYYV